MLIPKEFAFWPSAANPEVGMLFCEQSDTGAHVTVAGDPHYVRMLKALPDGLRGGLELSRDRLPLSTEGWPDEWDDAQDAISSLKALAEDHPW